MNRAEALLRETEFFVRQVAPLHFSGTIAAVYNPLVYAIEPYSFYIKKYATTKKRVLFLGMNPGPWGMAQTGIPFGEITHVKNWLGITGHIGHPEKEHPRRPITGWECNRSEVSGKRLWELMKERFITPENFFKDHFIANYCPLVFMGETGKNITPDKLRKKERDLLFEYCDNHLQKTIDIFEPEYLIGIGKFAEKKLIHLTKERNPAETYQPVVASIIHPSPANPQAHNNWKGKVTEKLIKLGVWKE